MFAWLVLFLYRTDPMHELAVTQSILEIALRHAQEAEARKVTLLHLVIGQLSSIIDDSVQFYWDIVSQGTIAEGAKLEFERIPAELQCLDCNTHYHLTQEDLVCPQCQGVRIKVVAGDEFTLQAIDIEK